MIRFDEDIEYIWISVGEQVKPGDSIYSIVAVHIDVLQSDILKDKLCDFLNHDLKCEGTELVDTDLQYDPVHYICIFVQTWG